MVYNWTARKKSMMADFIDCNIFNSVVDKYKIVHPMLMSETFRLHGWQVLLIQIKLGLHNVRLQQILKQWLQSRVIQNISTG